METRLALGVIVVITFGTGMTILAASAEPKQEQLRLQLASNTNNMIRNETISLSSPSSQLA